MGSEKLTLVVQEIVVLYTKASRDEPLRGQRSAVSRARRLPAVQQQPGTLLKHRLVYSEASGFSVPEETWEVLPVLGEWAQGCLLLEPVDGNWLVTYRYSASSAGLPQRNDVPQRRSLLPGQWGRVCYEGRIPDREQVVWVYCARTFNIAWLVESSPAVFLAGETVWTIEDRMPEGSVGP